MIKLDSYSATIMRKFERHSKYLLGSSSSLKRELLRGFSGMAGAKFVNLVLAFVSSMMLARILGPDVYGAYAFIMSVIAFLALLSYIGLPALMTREISKYEQSNNWGLIRGMLLRSNQLVSGVSILIVLMLAALSMTFSSTSELDRWQLLLIALPIVPLVAHIKLMMATLRGFKRIVAGVVPELIIRPCVFLVALSCLLFVGQVNVDVVIFLQVVAALVAAVVGYKLVRKETATNIKIAAIEYRDKDWILALIPFIGLAGVSFLNVEFINIFLGLAGTNHDVAMFRIAANIAVFVALPLTLIESVISPYITRLYHSGDIDKLQKLAQVASLASLLASAVPAIVLLLFGTEIITILYGADYEIAYSPLVVIISGYMVVNLVGLSMQLLYATEYHTSAFRISLYGAFITVLICSFLIPVYGALGAGIALGFGKALRSVLYVAEARRLLKIKTSLIW